MSTVLKRRTDGSSSAPPPPLARRRRRRHRRRNVHGQCSSCSTSRAAPTSARAVAIAGVGVFALREIPARTDPFQGPNAHLRLPETVVSVTQSELDELEPAVRTHVLSMFGTLDDPRPRGGPLRDRKGDLVYGALATGIESFDTSWYVNHAVSPNLVMKEGDEGFNRYFTTRAVAAGEELTPTTEGCARNCTRARAPTEKVNIV